MAVLLGSAGMSEGGNNCGLPPGWYCAEKESPGEKFIRELFSSKSKNGNYKKGYSAYEFQEYDTALSELRPLAEQGTANAQSVLGEMYRDGKGVTQDDKTAVKWYTLAAENGHPFAQKKLEWMYHKINLLKSEKTTERNRLAAEQRDRDAKVASKNLSIKIQKDLAEKKARKATGKTSHSYNKKQQLVVKAISTKYFNFRTYKLLCRKDHAGIIPITKKYMELMRKLHAKVLGSHAEGKKWSALKDRAFELSNPLVEDWKKDSGLLLVMYASLSGNRLRQPCSSSGKLGNIVVSLLRMENNLIQQKINKSSGKKEKRAF